MTSKEKEIPYLKGEGFYIEPSEVKVNARARQFFDSNEMEKLKESINELGQLQPIIVTRELDLVAGERRTLACKDLSRRVWAAYLDNVDTLGLLKAELHENTCRAPLTPVEELKRKYEIHELLKEQEGPKHSARGTAKFLEESHTLTSEDLKMAEYVMNLPSKFEGCKTKSDIRKTVKNLDRKAEQFLLERSIKDLSDDERFKKINIPDEISSPIVFTGEQLNEEEIRQMEVAFEAASSDAIEEADEDSAQWIAERVRDYERRLLVGDAFEVLPKLDDNSIDIFFLDPPWGVGLDEKVERGGLKGDGYKDDQKGFLESFPLLLDLAFKKLRKEGFLFCFFAINYHNFVYQSLQDSGFNANWRPIIICKENIHSSQVASYWPASSYEPVAIAKKGRPQLINRGAQDHLLTRWLGPSEKYGFVSAKPAECYLYLLRMVARPGDVVCDPMYGSGSAFVACEQAFDLKINWFGWDNDDGKKTGENRRRSLLRLSEWAMKFADEKKILEKLGQPIDAPEEAPMPDTYINLTPGTPEWTRYFKAHPEQQDEMLIFRRKLKEEN